MRHPLSCALDNDLIPEHRRLPVLCPDLADLGSRRDKLSRDIHILGVIYMEICVQEMLHNYQTASLFHLLRHSDLSSCIFHLDFRAEFSVRSRIGLQYPHGTSRLRIHQKPVGICFYKISAIFIKDREISQCIKPLHRIWPCHYLDPFSKYRASFDHDLPGG